jgi:hypothetical protein
MPSAGFEPTIPANVRPLDLRLRQLSHRDRFCGLMATENGTPEHVERGKTSSQTGRTEDPEISRLFSLALQLHV